MTFYSIFFFFFWWESILNFVTHKNWFLIVINEKLVHLSGNFVYGNFQKDLQDGLKYVRNIVFLKPKEAVYI